MLYSDWILNTLNFERLFKKNACVKPACCFVPSHCSLHCFGVFSWFNCSTAGWKSSLPTNTLPKGTITKETRVFSKRLISPAFSRSFDPETININWWHYLIFFYEEREAAVTASSSAHWKLLWKLSQNDQWSLGVARRYEQFNNLWPQER